VIDWAQEELKQRKKERKHGEEWTSLAETCKGFILLLKNLAEVDGIQFQFHAEQLPRARSTVKLRKRKGKGEKRNSRNTERQRIEKEEK
jgi:hypothetical protein